MTGPTLHKEIALLKQGYHFVAGLDEAGRGAWAGPVVAAAVILPLTRPDLAPSLNGLRDSKQLSPVERDRFFDLVQKNSLGIGIGLASPGLVDEINVVEATRYAMERALLRLAPRPQYLLLDHIRLPAIELPQEAFPKAETISLSVAAASVIAKVTRDRLMIQYHAEYPDYAFDAHKGYGTPAHRAALGKFGPCPLHRMSYRPLKEPGLTRPS